MAFAMLRRGRPISIPPPEKAVRFLESEGQALATAPPGRRAVVGSPQTVAAGLHDVAEEYGADELIVVAITHDHGARRRSYELIAEAFDLVAARPAEQIAS
jgi:alkanesulfonate monooxygenase SsuD/methylene tetrahydromethanopterin reductase-like flavin-dependent oxidoreductase (luciferase family)